MFETKIVESTDRQHNFSYAFPVSNARTSGTDTTKRERCGSFGENLGKRGGGRERKVTFGETQIVILYKLIELM